MTTQYEKGLYATTELNYKRQGGTTILTIHPTTGNYDGQLAKRSYTIVFPVEKDIKDVRVNNNKAQISFSDEHKAFILKVKEMDIRKGLVISCISGTFR